MAYSKKRQRDADFYKNRTSPEREQMVENRKATMALRLLRRIVDELDSTNFTLQDIKEGFNPQIEVAANEMTKIIRFGQSNLDWLVEKGIIEKDLETGNYCVVNSVNTAIFLDVLGDVGVFKPEEED